MSHSPTNTFGDIASFIAGVAVFLADLTTILSFFVAFAGAVWWIIRFYNYFKEKRNGNVRID